MAKSEELIQGSDAWHEFRLKGLGSSDAPVIMDVSPHRTRYQLWEEKTRRVKRATSSNWAQARGNNLEPMARAHYEVMNAIEMPPLVCQHYTYPFLRASLDGYNEEAGIVLEIKCLGKEKHGLAKKGRIPNEYIPQLDHQLLVTGAQRVHYYSFDGTDGALVEHLPDIERLKKLLSAELEFWKLIEFDEPPPFSDRDYIKIKDKQLLKSIRDWKKAETKLRKYKDQESELRSKIIKNISHPLSIGAGVKIQKIFRKGSVDYSQVPQLVGVDLDSFRKKGSESWRLDIEK